MKKINVYLGLSDCDPQHCVHEVIVSNVGEAPLNLGLLKFDEILDTMYSFCPEYILNGIRDSINKSESYVAEHVLRRIEELTSPQRSGILSYPLPTKNTTTTTTTASPVIPPSIDLSKEEDTEIKPKAIDGERLVRILKDYQKDDVRLEQLKKWLSIHDQDYINGRDVFYVLDTFNKDSSKMLALKVMKSRARSITKYVKKIMKAFITPELRCEALDLLCDLIRMNNEGLSTNKKRMIEEEGVKCMICTVNAPDILFDECHHAVMCTNCSETYTKEGCFLCKNKSKRTKIYF